ncbi:YcaO-like family protein, partial [Streptosporangium sandarakinum]
TRWRRLEVSTVDDEDCRHLLALYADAGVRVDVVAATRPGAFPACFEARIRSEALPVTFTGAGCHLNPAIALCRALTEAAQSRLTAIAGARDDLPALLYRAPASAAGEDLGRPITWNGRSASAADLAADTDTLARHIAQLTGSQPVRVTLPSPTGLAVVKVIAPGLAFDARTDVSAGRAA